VEEVVRALRQEAEPQTTDSAVCPAVESPAVGADARNLALSFVQTMGGFAQARAAIDALESKLR
jgi:hypothetical protein